MVGATLTDINDEVTNVHANEEGTINITVPNGASISTKYNNIVLTDTMDE